MRSRRKLLTTFVLLTLCAGLLATAAPAQALGKDVQQRILRASVKLMTPFDADKNQGSLCSGTMLSAEGYILTNFHCVGYVAGERDRTLESMGLRQGDFYNKQRL